ncbi:unnamed protein product [Trichogramma brassicae]|uniref:Uncharacterized protein n=1 Tax=Trichogramma brassicae TaxID=86971 RepID=A0A6H5IHZ2_9HYME|nr:unnamed protein product [Trichogramma brassicae]
MPAMCDHAADGSEKGDTTIDDGIVQDRSGQLHNLRFSVENVAKDCLRKKCTLKSLLRPLIRVHQRLDKTVYRDEGAKQKRKGSVRGDPGSGDALYRVKEKEREREQQQHRIDTPGVRFSSFMSLRKKSVIDELFSCTCKMTVRGQADALFQFEYALRQYERDTTWRAQFRNKAKRYSELASFIEICTLNYFHHKTVKADLLHIEEESMTNLLGHARCMRLLILIENDIHITENMIELCRGVQREERLCLYILRNNGQMQVYFFPELQPGEYVDLRDYDEIHEMLQRIETGEEDLQFLRQMYENIIRERIREQNQV